MVRKFKRGRDASLNVAVVIGLSWISSFAHAQDFGSNDIEDVVVATGVRSSFDPVRISRARAIFTAREIEALGVLDFEELLAQILSTLDEQSDKPPIILLNGRPVQNLAEVQAFPSEAIHRVSVLSQEDGVAFAARPDQAVVNIALKDRFEAWTTRAVCGGSTEGGGRFGFVDANRLEIRDKGRLSIGLKVDRKNAILESQRDIALPNLNVPISREGVLIPVGRRAELDPRLSELVGIPVTSVRLPAMGLSDETTLGDLLTGINPSSSDDPRLFRSLEPDEMLYTLTASYFRPVGDRYALRGGLTVRSRDSESLRGLARARVQVDPGMRNSPFSQAVELSRYVGPLSQSLQQDSIELTGDAFGDYPTWRWNVSGRLRLSDNRRDSTLLLDSDILQTRLDTGDPAFDLAIPDSFIGLRETARNDFSGQLRARVNGQVLQLPAGLITGSATLTARQESLENRFLFGVQSDASTAYRNGVALAASLDIPLTGRPNRRNAGTTTLSLNAEIENPDDFALLWTYGASINWRMRQNLVLRARQDVIADAPNLSRLSDINRVDSNIRVFDFVSGRTVFVDRLTGGNEALLPQQQNKTDISLNWEPRRDLRLGTSWQRSRTTNAVSGFPFVTPLVVEAFPDRLVFDEDGVLSAFDTRPVNVARRETQVLQTSLKWIPSRLSGRRSTDDPAGSELNIRKPASSSQKVARALRRGQAQRKSVTTLSVDHTWRLVDEYQARLDSDVFDLLDGAAIRRQGSAPEHKIRARLTLGRPNYGGVLTLNHASGTRIVTAARADGQNNSVQFDPLTTADLRFYYDLGRKSDGRQVGRKSWRRHLRLSLDVENVGDNKTEGRNARGDVPNPYRQDVLDPFGRVVRLTLRKQIA